MGGNTLSDKQRGWLEHIEACASGGGSMKVYAEHHGLNLQRFYFWKGRLKKSGQLRVQGATTEFELADLRLPN